MSSQSDAATSGSKRKANEVAASAASSAAAASEATSTPPRGALKRLRKENSPGASRPDTSGPEGERLATVAACLDPLFVPSANFQPVYHYFDCLASAVAADPSSPDRRPVSVLRVMKIVEGDWEVFDLLILWSENLELNRHAIKLAEELHHSRLLKHVSRIELGDSMELWIRPLPGQWSEKGGKFGFIFPFVEKLRTAIGARAYLHEDMRLDLSKRTLKTPRGLSYDFFATPYVPESKHAIVT